MLVQYEGWFVCRRKVAVVAVGVYQSLPDMRDRPGDLDLRVAISVGADHGVLENELAHQDAACNFLGWIPLRQWTRWCIRASGPASGEIGPI